MTNDTNFLIYLVVSLIGLSICFFFIYYATGAKERKRQLQLQNAILIHIAKKIGVDQDTIDQFQALNNK